MQKNGIRFLAAALCVLTLGQLLAGCGETENNVPETAETTEATVPATVPADGNPNDVTCKGTYSADSVDSAAVVATLGNEKLTGGQLQVYYWMEVSSYRQAGYEIAPDFDKPLDTQSCEIDGSVASWQQYFLKRALIAWHTAQALSLQSVEEGLPTEEAYQPNEEKHETYMTGMPATAYLYGYNNNYRINTLHQQFLDNIPQMLSGLAQEKGFADTAALAKDIAGASAEELSAYVELNNLGYMYYTALSYDLDPTEEEVEAYFAENEESYAQAGVTRDSGRLVDIRHILVLPQDGEDGTVESAWNDCEAAAQALAEQYEINLRKSRNRANKTTEDAVFAELANKNSQDTGSALNGGLYQKLRRGELAPVLDDWCFDPARQSGDVAVLRSDAGYHVVFFKGSTDIWYDTARQDLIARLGWEKILQARKTYPCKIDYSAISLGTAVQSALVTASELLYADVGHQRYPEVQLYLQQDYPTTMYGNYKITSHGCGITTMSMLATYMSDTELTPPEMCKRYGGYCYQNGTDGSLFSTVPAELGFYLQKKTYKPMEARDAMREGYMVVCVQTKGYWTRGGHYLLLEKMFDGDKIQVRDSNLYNYGRLENHKIDLFDFSTVIPSGVGYWIYENKVVTIPQCARCGNPEEEGAPASMFREDYLCEKCGAALLRRNTYLTYSGI